MTDVKEGGGSYQDSDVQDKVVVLTSKERKPSKNDVWIEFIKAAKECTLAAIKATTSNLYERVLDTVDKVVDRSAEVAKAVVSKTKEKIAEGDPEKHAEEQIAKRDKVIVDQGEEAAKARLEDDAEARVRAYLTNKPFGVTSVDITEPRRKLATFMTRADYMHHRPLQSPLWDKPYGKEENQPRDGEPQDNDAA